MHSYQLCLREPLPVVLDRIADVAVAMVPALGRERARRIAELVFLPRVRQTTACGTAEACQAIGRPVWGFRSPAQGPAQPVGLTDPDASDLPMLFGAAAADALSPPDRERKGLEERLAGGFRAILAPLLFHHAECGHAEVCDAAPPVDPLQPKRR